MRFRSYTGVLSKSSSSKIKQPNGNKVRLLFFLAFCNIVSYFNHGYDETAEPRYGIRYEQGDVVGQNALQGKKHRSEPHGQKCRQCDSFGIARAERINGLRQISA